MQSSLSRFKGLNNVSHEWASSLSRTAANVLTVK